jgi:tetratricopeptide (TPR) repeat protein
MHDYAGAREQYRRGIALNPNDPNLHYNLGVTYGEQGDFLSDIAEYREVKRLDPSRTDARQNLGAALLHTDPVGAIAEFRELAELAPDFPVCHLCLANALSSVGKNAEAEKELEIAKSKDPGDANSYVAMGYLREQQRKYEVALSEFRNAESLDPKSGAAFGGAGRVLVEEKQFQAALSELSRAEELDPGNWEHHQLHGEALEALGDRKGAVAEFQKATSLGPKEVKPRLSLALAQEKNGDWAYALANYHQAATDEPTPKANAPAMQYHPQEKYLAAQSRFKQYVAQLRASGKAADAEALEHSVNAVASASGLDSQYHEALQASMTATQARKLDGAETAAKQAVAIAEKMAACRKRSANSATCTPGARTIRTPARLTSGN